MAGSGDSKRPERSRPPRQPGSPDVWATLPPGQRNDDTSSAERTGPYQPPAPGPFPRLPAEFGRYRVMRQLGSGGMGTVYLARDTKLDRLVALKVPHFTAADGPQARQRFLREARAAATLQHPNLCPVFDAGEVDGTPYLTMAYLEGTPLDRLIAEAREPLPERQVAALVRKLALALAEAHARGVCHRDLKPGNVMLNARGEPVVMDFGLARRAGRPDRTAASLPGLTSPRVVTDACLTQAGALLGTPAYMAPEQAEGDPELMGPACDVYSLGVILYELLTGRLPFEGQDVFTLLARVLTEEPRPPSAYRPGLDPRLEAICLKALAKRPEQRHRGMAEFAAVLTAFLTATAELPAAPQPKPTEEAREAAPPLPRRRRRRGAPGELPAWAWAGIVGVSAALAVAIGAWLVALARPSFGEVRVELRPPSARVEVRVDGEPVAGDLENLVLKLPVGPHTLEVSGENYRPVTMQFPVRSSDNPPVVVVLEQVPSPQSPALPIAREQEKAPSGPPAGGSDAPPNAPKAKAPAPPPDAAAKKPAPPPGPPALRWERQDDLVGGRIKAPNFNAPKVLFQDDFKNPTSGFLNSQLDGKWYAGRTAKGRFSPFYAIQPKKGVAWAESQVPLGPANTPDPADPFEIKVVGRAVGRAGSWGVGLGDAEASNMLDVNLILYHKPMLGGSIVGYWRDLTPRPDLPLREGVSRELRLVVSGRYVEVYIDGVAACDPILLKRGLGKPRFYLGANAPNRDGKFQAEFSAVQVMSGRSLAPVTARGAVPK